MWWLNLTGRASSLLSWAPMVVLTLAAGLVATVGIIAPSRAPAAERLCRLLLMPVKTAAEARDPT